MYSVAGATCDIIHSGIIVAVYSLRGRQPYFCAKESDNYHFHDLIHPRLDGVYCSLLQQLPVDLQLCAFTCL